ncbi:MAG: 2Fe-2S iron-sulfur cluster binding domain-containing protein, partial [Proteobacteria bacterium]
MNAAEKMIPIPVTVEFELDGRKVQALEGETILECAERLGTEIPRLCYTPGYRPDGNCRACVVEIDGERTLAPSCCRSPTQGMKVKATSDRATKSQKLVVEMLLSDMPEQGYKWDGNDSTRQHGELSVWAARLGVQVRPELKAIARHQPPADLSHPAMAVNLDACIQCNRCVRACREEQVNDVIGYAFRGGHSAIVFDLQDGMGDSTCVACGECVQACPTGALMPKTHIGSQEVDRKVDSVCPFCGVGCLITYNIKDEQIVSVDGRDGPANHNRLCVKGRFGFDYVHHPQRLTVPLIRKPGVPKNYEEVGDPSKWRDVFREATWDEALDLAAGKLKGLKDQHGLKALAGFGSAKGSNEEAYLFQKLVRTGFGSNNVDHCTRLCHASSVAALLEGVGSAAVSNQVNDVEHADLILVIGSNPTANHPVAATWMKNAAKKGTKIVLADPRVTDIGRYAWRTLQFRADTDVALLNAVIHTVIDEGLVNQEFIANRANNFEALKENVKGYSAEAMAPICGIPAETIREVAREFATCKAAMILWGMGISQHVHGTDNARCLIALVSVTGQIGKPGSGLHPLRGQNNVQGASDAGLIPMMFPNYQRVDNAGAHAWFEDFWGTQLDEKPGYTVVEI